MSRIRGSTHDAPQPYPRPRPVPLPAGPGRPGDIAADLAVLLRIRGLVPAVYAPAGAVLAVVSITAGLTAWTDGITLAWRHAGTRTTWPAGDIPGAAVQLARIARGDRPARAPRPAPPPGPAPALPARPARPDRPRPRSARLHSPRHGRGRR
jgi:hypothetical protein